MPAQRRVTVELDVVPANGQTLSYTSADAQGFEKELLGMTAPPSHIDVDTDRTNCCQDEEYWLEEDSRYGCGHCGRSTRRTIEHEVALTRGPNGWPLVAFHGPEADIEHMLERSGYEDGLATYEVS